MKRYIIWLCIFIPGLFYLVDYFAEGRTWAIGGVTLREISSKVSNSLPVLLFFALGLGIINVFRVHLMTVLNRRKGWILSLVVFLSFIAVAGVSVWEELTRAQREAWKSLPLEQRIERRLQGEAPPWYVENSPIELYTNYVSMPLGSTTMALLGFYITYAAYRAFRIRSAEATFMMLAAALCLLGFDPIGNRLTSWIPEGTAWRYLHLPSISEFLLSTVNAAVWRSLGLGMNIAVIVIALRMWLGLERGVVEPPPIEE